VVVALGRRFVGAFLGRVQTGVVQTGVAEHQAPSVPDDVNTNGDLELSFGQADQGDRNAKARSAEGCDAPAVDQEQDPCHTKATL
jgi:hypothetical protein